MKKKYTFTDFLTKIYSQLIQSAKLNCALYRGHTKLKLDMQK